MNRRSFIRAVVSLPIVASLPSLALTSKPSAYSGLIYYNGWIGLTVPYMAVIYSSINNPMSWDASDYVSPLN